MLALTWWQFPVVFLPNVALFAWQAWEIRHLRAARRRFIDAVKVRGWSITSPADAPADAAPLDGSHIPGTYAHEYERRRRMRDGGGFS